MAGKLWLAHRRQIVATAFRTSSTAPRIVAITTTTAAAPLAASMSFSMAVRRELLARPPIKVQAIRREFFYRKSDLAYTRETVDCVVVAKSTPSRLTYMWPMRVGQMWDQSVVLERPVARQTEEVLDATMVEARDSNGSSRIL
jgi:hypothetical protein